MNFELTREYLENLQQVIEKKDEATAKSLMDDLHAADIAEIYDELNIDEAKFLYILLDGEKAADVLAELEDDDRERFLKVLPSDVIAKEFINYMDTDDAADVLADMPEEKKQEVLSYIEDVEHAGDIVDLLEYDEDTAGGLMGKEYLAVNINWTIKNCYDLVRENVDEIDEVFYVYVVDEDNKLKGVLSLKDLIIFKYPESVADVYTPDPVYVTTKTDSEEVANLMDKYDLVALPVVDDIGRIVGRITIDDVVDVLRDEAEKDYQMASGISEDIEPSDSVWRITRARMPWLMIGLFGGVMGARVIGMFEGDLARNAATALFLPLIAAMAGNVGVQSSAIVVQGLAANTIGLDSVFKKIMKEISVALLNGLACALVILAYNLIFSDSLALTFSVSISLFIVIIFASIFGTFVPLALNRFKIDPALATGPFITTVNDIVGLGIYLITSRMIFAMFENG